MGIDVLVQQPVEIVPIHYVEVDTKNRLLDIKPSRVKMLADSMQQVQCILTPLLVTLKGGPDSYQIVAGATRLAAAKQLNWYEVPIRVISGTEDEIKQVEIEENLGRHDLTDEERKRLERAREQCRSNIDAAIAEAKALAKAHPKETAEAEAEAERIGANAAAALRRRPTKKTAGGTPPKPKREHRATGNKKGRPEGGVAAIAKRHGVANTTLRRKIGAISDRGHKKPRKVICPRCAFPFELK